MESRTLQTFLRVLYTVNSNPQYILAKSVSPVPAIPCNETSRYATSEPAYARVPLKACLVAVCDSSPELLQDPARDFSLYVLDPLEAQPLPSSLANPSHNSNSPRGVAVALGLMSWALESNDSRDVLVTGTVIPNASPALEVVFAFRETKRLPKPMVYSYPSYGPMPGPSSSQPPNHPYLPLVAGMSWLPTPSLQHNQQEQRTLTRSSEFPELYIGPPRRARGRPEGSTTSKSKVKSQDSASAQPEPSSSVGSHSESKQEGRVKAKQKAKARPQKPPPTHSPFIRAPLNRHSTRGGSESGAFGTPAIYPQSHPTSQNQNQSHTPHHSQGHPTHDALIGLLSAISSSSGNTTANATPGQQAALLLALQGLLSSNPHLLQLASTNAGLSVDNAEQVTETKPMHSESNADDEHDDGDSDIIILDSSTVDTTAFRKPGGRENSANGDDTSSLANNQEYAISSSQGTDNSPLPASTPPSGQEDTPGSSQVSTPSIGVESTPTATPEAMIPTSKQVSPGRTERNDVTTQCILDMPETPTPCRTRKRKLDEYVQDQIRSSPPTSSPSPSPSVTLTSKLGKVLTGRQLAQSSPGRGPASVSSPLARLPSMLGSIRAAAASSSRMYINSSSSSMMHLVPLTTKNDGSQTTMLDSGSSKADRPVSSNSLASDSASLKRRRTLNEVMAEQEARKDAKIRKRSSSGRNSQDVPATAPQATSTHSAKVSSTWRHAQSSPPRPLFRSDLVAPSSISTLQSCLVPGTAVSNPASSFTMTKEYATPPLPTSSATSTKNPVRKFVLPGWARTSTATLPRLSEEALARQRAEQEAKKAQASLKRQEAAKAKRNRHRGVECPSKESSDDDDETAVDHVRRPVMHPPSNVARNVLSLPPPPPPSLPVFASDVVEPVPSSPPQSPGRFMLPNVPSTPPRKPGSSGSGSHRTPSKSGSCSLFTPSGQDLGSLFTPSTPSVARSLTRATFTSRSPTVLHRSGAKRSPRKSITQTPWTPKHNNNQTPKSLRMGRSSQFVSPGMAIRTPQAQTGRETRAFLLPPPSPCASRSSHLQVHTKAPISPTPNISEGGAIMKRVSPSDKRSIEQDKGYEEGDRPSCDPGNTLRGEDTPIPPEQAGYQEIGQLCDIETNGNPSRAEAEYASSPLPPSSPLPTSPLSSPERHRDHGCNYDGSPTINSLSVPDSDILLPSVGDSDGPGAEMDWLSDDACTATWFTDTETWLTDAEGGLLPTDSDVGAWLSDSDAVFGDMSSLPQSSASNWFSDDADVDTDGELAGAMGVRSGEFDAAAFERAFAALVQRGAGESASTKNENDGGAGGAAQGAGAVEASTDLWETLRPLLGENGADDVGGTATGGMGDSLSGEKAAEELQELLEGLVDA